MPDDVQFQSDTRFQGRGFEPKTPAMVKLAMKLSGGLIRAEKQATFALLGLVGIIIIVTLYLFGII